MNPKDILNMYYHFAVVGVSQNKEKYGYKIFKRLLEKNNFIQVSQNGSHVKMRNIENGKQVIVPFHNKELKKGTEQGILKQAGIK